jgi:hypothetical protein
MEFMQELLPMILEFVLVFAVPAILGVVARWAAKRNEATTDGRVSAAYQMLHEIADVHLTSINKEITEKLKLANEDGKITPEEAAHIKAFAKNRIWETLPGSAKDLLIAVIPGGEDGIAGRLLDPLIEFGLKRLKAGGMIPTTEELREKATTITDQEAAKARARIGLLGS